jgi:ubiquitin-conjugating enzyme E2 J1
VRFYCSNVCIPPSFLLYQDNMFEWHFTMRGPDDSEFEGGIYHGRILLRSEYPFKPPDIMLLTPSGRFEVNTKICLSISGFHPKNWQPAWSIRTILTALQAFFTTAPEGAIGSLDCSQSVRRMYAKESVHVKCDLCGKCNSELLPPRPSVTPTAVSSSSSKSKSSSKSSNSSTDEQATGADATTNDRTPITTSSSPTNNNFSHTASTLQTTEGTAPSTSATKMNTTTTTATTTATAAAAAAATTTAALHESEGCNSHNSANVREEARDHPSLATANVHRARADHLLTVALLGVISQSA